MKFDYSSVLLTAINLLLFSVTSRSYDTAFDTFHQSSAGKIFADKLSYLQVYIGSLGSSTVHESKNETHQKNPDKIHERELEQLERYRSIHPKLVDIVPEIRRAIRSIYPEAMHAADVVQHESGKITGTIKKHSSKQEMTGMGSISPNAATSDEQVIDAIVLDNIRKILQSLKDSASPEQLQSILGDKRELAKRLLRGDMELDDEDFKKTHFGLDTEKIRTLKDAKLSATFLETLNNYLYVKPLSPKKKINYCHENNRVCDRRINKDSCESRFHIGDQGNCGSCWAFAGVYHISLHHCLATGSDSLFSIQEIMDCSRAHCHGGFHGDVAMYLQRYNRIADERSYPYEYRRVYCRSHMKPNTWTGIYAKNLQHEILGIVTKSRLGYTDDQWKTLIKKLISLFGSVVHYLNGHQIRYEAGLRPVFLCDRSEYTNHAVLLTGWKVMNGVNVWILRNSWGESWGENGYAYIAMDSRCGPDSDPVIQLDLMEFDRWKDEVEDDVVIRTRSNNRSNNDLKTEKVQIGQTINLSCLKERKKIHINNFHVMKYGRVAEKQYCSNLKLDNSCENKRTCSLYFGYGLCDAGFNQLVVQYECIDSSHTPSPNPRPDSSPGPSPSPPHPRRNVDCNKVEALYPRIQPRSSCLRLCTAVSRMCSEINCFYRYIKKAYCNLDKIFLSTPEPAKKFNCSNAIATHENLFSTGECIKYCEGFLPYCETRECLATKVGKFYCDLSKI